MLFSCFWLLKWLLLLLNFGKYFYRRMASENDEGVQSFSSSPMPQPPLVVSNPTAPSINLESATGDDSPTPPSSSAATSRKTRQLWSDAWLHFKKVIVGGEEKAECLHCGQKLSAAGRNGTSHLNDHYKTRCPKKHMKIDVMQKMLQFSRNGDGTAHIENHNRGCKKCY